MKPHKYTDEEKRFLIEFAPGHSRKEITAAFNEKFGSNLDVRRITGAMKRYGAKTGRTGYFEKGGTAWNKGKKMTPEQYEKSKATMFKKGNKPHNHLPVSSERISTDGYKEVKIAEPNEWKGKHILVYEQAYGKVPEGHVINFLDGNPLNIELDNLVCISRREHLFLNQNGYRFKDRDSNELSVNVARLTSKISERKGDKR